MTSDNLKILRALLCVVLSETNPRGSAWMYARVVEALTVLDTLDVNAVSDAYECQVCGWLGREPGEHDAWVDVTCASEPSRVLVVPYREGGDHA